MSDDTPVAATVFLKRDLGFMNDADLEPSLTRMPQTTFQPKSSDSGSTVSLSKLRIATHGNRRTDRHEIQPYFSGALALLLGRSGSSPPVSLVAEIIALKFGLQPLIAAPEERRCNLWSLGPLATTHSGKIENLCSPFSCFIDCLSLSIISFSHRGKSVDTTPT
jgi:hypothetical protein